MATGTTRAPNKGFPHGAEVAEKVQKRFAVGMKVVGEQAPRGGGDPQPVIATVTHVVKNGWIYVQVEGRSTDKQADPTVWKPATEKDIERVKAAQAKAAAAPKSAAKPAVAKGATNGVASAKPVATPAKPATKAKTSPSGEAAAAAGSRTPI